VQDPAVLKIWNVLRVVQTTTGFTLGLYLYIYGLFFFDKFGGDANPQAITWTTSIFVIGNIVILICDVPTGALADAMGRRKAVIWSFIFRAAFFLLMCLMSLIHLPQLAYGIGIVGYALFGVGYALFSGAMIAWVVDSIRVRKLAEGHGPMLTSSYKYLFTAQIIGAVFGLWLYMEGLIFIAFVAGLAACAICSLFCGLYMEETEGMRFHEGRMTVRHMVTHTVEKMQLALQIFRAYPIVFYLSVLFALFMLLNHIVAYLWPVFMKSSFGFGKMSTLWFAIVFACLWLKRVGAQLMSAGTQRLRHAAPSTARQMMRRWLIGVATLSTLPIFLLNAVNGLPESRLTAFVVLLCMVSMAYGVIRPCFETLVNHYIPADNAMGRATVLSIANMMISLFVILLMIPSGGESGATTVRGWLIPATVLLLACGVGHLLIRRAEGRMESTATQAAVSGS
jgi:MFS transporter, DHA3 family, tetracycline resistance protein